MKIRTGFVSNSSSSSFVIVINKTDWDREYAALGDFEKAAVDFVCSYGVKKEGKLNGNNIVMYGYADGNASPFEYAKPEFEGKIPEKYNYKEEGYINWSEAVEEFDSKLRKYQHLACGFDF